MNIKNYTSETPVNTSLGKIENMLVQIGCTDINKQYRDKICTGITCLYYDSQVMQTIPFHFTADTEACFAILWKEIKRPRQDTKQKTMEQAARTAWKIISDLIELQCSMILMGQGKPLQLFLANMYDVKKNETLFDKFVSGDIKLLN